MPDLLYKKSIVKYIIAMRNDGKFKKELNINDSAKYINMLFSLSQVMKNSGSKNLI